MAYGFLIFVVIFAFIFAITAKWFWLFYHRVELDERNLWDRLYKQLFINEEKERNNIRVPKKK